VDECPGSLADIEEMSDAFQTERRVRKNGESRRGPDRDREETALFTVDRAGEAKAFSDGTRHSRDYLASRKHGDRRGRGEETGDGRGEPLPYDTGREGHGAR
jgi:hypothetical protein